MCKAMRSYISEVNNKIMRFSCVGIVVAVFQLSMSSGLMEMRVDPAVAVSISFVLAMGVSYISQKKWTFNNRKSHAQVFFRYISAQGMALMVSAMAATYISSLDNSSSIFIAAVAALVAGSISFILGLFWVFK